MTDAEPWTPLCMTPAEWARWQESNEQCAGNEAVHPCRDCLAWWREANAAVGTCNEPERPSGQMGLDLFHAA
jgi:hypothetical protein